MKNLISMLTSLFILFIFTVPPAHALRVIVATIFMGEVQVIGIQAKKNADINWEGAVVTHANKAGAFLFSTTNLPIDCVGQLSDSVSTISVVLNDCTTKPVLDGVLQTGQTTCYDITGTVIPCAGTGQDGELQKGRARIYSDNGQTITDNVTGLEWEKLCMGGACPAINNVATSYTWAQAFQKIADLNTANFAGHHDWRLPNINELQTLADYGRRPAIDPVFNNGDDSFTQWSFYWSSTAFASGPALELFANFTDGTVTGYTKWADWPYVRAVRGGS